MAPIGISVAVMEMKSNRRRRKMIQRSFRIFEDQLESLYVLADTSHRGRLNVSDLVRIFLDQGIDGETPSRHGRS